MDPVGHGSPLRIHEESGGGLVATARLARKARAKSFIIMMVCFGSETFTQNLQMGSAIFYQCDFYSSANAEINDKKDKDDLKIYLYSTRCLLTFRLLVRVFREIQRWVICC